MGIEDKRIARLLLRDLYRYQSLDLTDIKVTVIHGIGYLGGVIRPAPGLYSLNMKEEMRIVTESSKKIPGLRSLVIDAKLESSPVR